MKIFIVILFILITLNFYMDSFVDNIQTNSLKSLLTVTNIHQKIFNLHNQQLKDISSYQNEMHRIYYGIAEIAIMTKIQCDIERAERLQEENGL